MDKEKDEEFEFLDDFDDDAWDEERWEWFLQGIEEDGYNGEGENGNTPQNLEEEGYFDETDSVEPWKDQDENRKIEKENWESERKLQGFKKIDAYIISYQFGLAVDSYARKIYRNVNIPEIKTILSNCFVAARKITIGHKIGYDRDTIKGNIVSCKQGLKAIEKCIAALKKMQIKSIRKPGINLLIKLGSNAKDAVRDWIEDLQDRIWW